jgi:hypothetical protein
MLYRGSSYIPFPLESRILLLRPADKRWPATIAREWESQSAFTSAERFPSTSVHSQARASTERPQKRENVYRSAVTLFEQNSSTARFSGH